MASLIWISRVTRLDFFFVALANLIFDFIDFGLV
jgi:hypothetical protein